jgi:hypothetical protein
MIAAIHAPRSALLSDWVSDWVGERKGVISRDAIARIPQKNTQERSPETPPSLLLICGL